jgi:hypothetical protein
MSEKKNKKSNKKNSSNKNKNFTSIQTLPESFFEEMINLEISLRKNFTLENFQNLIEHYTKAIEFFSSTNDSRCERYKNNLKLLLNQKDVIKNINLNTKKGKIFVAKQNRKKIIEDCLNKIDLENNNNNNINLLRESIQIREKKNVENNLNKSMETQIDKFKKRKEEKKKKWLLNKSNISNENVDVNNNNNNKKKKVFSTKKNLNKSFDPIRNDENLFGNDEFEIEPMINVNNNIFDNNNNNFSLNDDKKNLTERLYEILDNFFKKFDEKFSQEFTINFINDLNELNKEKQKKLIENSQKISAKIKQIECELTQVENEEKKINLGKKIYEYENLKKKNDENINKEFKNKIVELKNNFKNNGINKLNLKEIKDNIVSSIENDVYNYMIS